jgi:excisionase family DNA binding protein
MKGGSNKLISVNELAGRWGMSPDTIYRNWRDWGVAAVRLGGNLRFRKRDIDAYEERNSECPAASDAAPRTPAQPRMTARARATAAGRELSKQSLGLGGVRFPRN